MFQQVLFVLNIKFQISTLQRFLAVILNPLREDVQIHEGSCVLKTTEHEAACGITSPVCFTRDRTLVDERGRILSNEPSGHSPPQGTWSKTCLKCLSLCVSLFLGNQNEGQGNKWGIAPTVHTVSESFHTAGLLAYLICKFLFNGCLCLFKHVTHILTDVQCRQTSRLFMLFLGFLLYGSL